MGGTKTNDKVTVYIVPAITDNKILPESSISSSCISDTIYIRASPGEFEPASFVIRSNRNVNSLKVESTKLTGNNGVIQSSNVDIRTVKCWYQGNYGNYINSAGRYLTPELLLKDDSLIKVTDDTISRGDVSNPKGRNYLKLTNGSYIDISNSAPQSQSLIIPISQRPVRDADNLQPVNIESTKNKQFWITVNVPNNTNEGNYSGIIYLKSNDKTITKIKLNLQVLPIDLPKSNLEYSIYYRGMITDKGSISSEEKTIEQFTAENKNMLNHGVTNPTVYHTSSDNVLKQVLSIRNNVGIDNTNLYYLGLWIWDNSKISYYKTLATTYGVSNLYAYGPDEQDMKNAKSQSQMTAVHNAGGKVLNAQSPEQADSVANILDLAVVQGVPNVTLANKYHSYGHKIFSYADPQVYPEYPRLFRMNYGLLLWQNDYDGAMDYAYQHSFGDIWNDFDDGTCRDHVFAYPTMNGVIDTIQWEGFREGVDDVRYLTALQNTIITANAQGKDTTEAENYLANLKNSDLSSQDLDVVRSQMANYTIELHSN